MDVFVNVFVEVADWAVTQDQRVKLVTHSLGSCIGVSIWDPEIRLGGMIHYMLPDASVAPHRAKENPAIFASTGVPAMFRAAFEMGARRDRLIVKVAGGSQFLDENGAFNIGKQNYLALRKLFWKNGVEIDAEDVGGTLSRTMRLQVGTGLVTLKTQLGEHEL